MSLHFLSDQCVPTEISETLRRHGHKLTLLRDVLPISSADSAVIAKTQELGAILVSLDSDFSDIVTYPPQAYGGIVAIQLKNHPETIPTLVGGFLAFLENNDQGLFRGKLIIVEAHR